LIEAPFREPLRRDLLLGISEKNHLLIRVQRFTARLARTFAAKSFQLGAEKFVIVVFLEALEQ